MADQSRSMYIATYSSGENLHHVGAAKTPVTSWLRACLPRQCANMASFSLIPIIRSSQRKHYPSRASDKGFCFLSSRHITAVNCFPLHKWDAKSTHISSSFTSLASHKLRWRNVSHTLRVGFVTSLWLDTVHRW